MKDSNDIKKSIFKKVSTKWTMLINMFSLSYVIYEIYIYVYIQKQKKNCVNKDIKTLHINRQTYTHKYIIYINEKSIRIMMFFEQIYEVQLVIIMQDRKKKFIL